MMELVVLQINGTYMIIGTEGISTPKYATYGISDAYLGTPNMVKRGIFFLARLPGPSEIIQNNRLKVIMTYFSPLCLSVFFFFILSFCLFIFSFFVFLSFVFLSLCLSVFLSFRLSVFSSFCLFCLSTFPSFCLQSLYLCFFLSLSLFMVIHLRLSKLF